MDSGSSASVNEDIEDVVNGVGKNLLEQLEAILDHDPFIDEIGFLHPSQFTAISDDDDVVTDESDDRSLSFDENTFWFKNHKLAISVLDLSSLYGAAKFAFMASRRAYDGAVLSSGVSSGDLPSRNGISDLGVHEREVMKHSKALLLLNPDLTTAWNSRKKVIYMQQDFSFFQEEFRLSALALSCGHKSENAWSHRRWLVKIVAERFENLQDVLKKESELVEHICQNSKMNYRAWYHRCWMVSYMEREQVLGDLQHTKRWTELHVADNCSFHYRRRLIDSLLKCGIIERQVDDEHRQGNDEIYDAWKVEFEWNKMMINQFCGRESLWIHRRFLSVRWIKNFSGQSDQCSTGNMELDMFLWKEFQLVQSYLDISEDSFGEARANGEQAVLYILWLSKQLPPLGRSKFIVKLKETIDLKSILNHLLQDKPQLWQEFVA